MSTSYDCAAYENRNAAYEARKAAILSVNKAVLFAALAAAGIARITVAFDGWDGKGQIESVVGYAADAEVTDLPGTSIEVREAVFDREEPSVSQRTLREIIETMAFEFLGEKHRGWEKHDGAFGEFRFTVARQRITLDFNERFTAATAYFHEL